jgi:murein L,D-transpeptidase YcbB/YkuD
LCVSTSHFENLEENITKRNSKEIGCEGVDWTHVAQDRNQYRVQESNGPLDSISARGFLDYINDH